MNEAQAAERNEALAWDQRKAERLVSEAGSSRALGELEVALHELQQALEDSVAHEAGTLEAFKAEREDELQAAYERGVLEGRSRLAWNIAAGIEYVTDGAKVVRRP